MDKAAEQKAQKARRRKADLGRSKNFPMDGCTAVVGFDGLIPGHTNLRTGPSKVFYRLYKKPRSRCPPVAQPHLRFPTQARGLKASQSTALFQSGMDRASGGCL